MSQAKVEKFIRELDSFPNSDYYGLKNHGATCYLNSVLQVLFMTQDFREAVNRCYKKDSSTFDSHLRCLFADLEKYTVNPQSIIKALGIKNIYEQRDAAEYFERILNLTSPEASQIFKWQLRHRNTCTKCKRCTDSESFIWTLPLSMDDSRHHTYSVADGLKAFFKSEKVSGENKMYCDQCDIKTAVTIECEITHFPEIVTLLLKRFSFDYSRMCYAKLKCCVDVPQTLTLQDCTYELYAVVNHFGGLKGGHYTAEIRSYETGAWYHFSDASVRKVKQSPFKSQDNIMRSSSAYLLMYRKVTRQNFERSNEADQEPYLPDAVVVEKHDVTERGKDLHNHLKQDSCEGRQKLLKESGDDAVAKKRQKERSVGGEREEKPEKQPNRDGEEAAARLRPCEETLPHRDTRETDAGTHRLPETHKLKSTQRKSQNSIQREAEQIKAVATNVNVSKEIPVTKLRNDEEQIKHKEHQSGSEPRRHQYDTNSKGHLHDHERTPKKHDQHFVPEKKSFPQKSRVSPKTIPAVAHERQNDSTAGNEKMYCAAKYATDSRNTGGSLQAVHIKQGGEDNVSVQRGNFDVKDQHLTRESQSQSVDTKKERSSSSSVSCTEPNSSKSKKKKPQTMCLGCIPGTAQNGTKRAKSISLKEKKPTWRW